MKIINNTSNAAHITASTMGALVGLAGIDHSIFEILQGNVAPEDLMISAIGPAQRFWEYGFETALTVIPNFLVSGILSVILGLVIIYWSFTGVNKRFGAGVLLILSVALFLVGGGFAPIFMTILGSIAASRINKPLNFWRKNIPLRLRKFLGKIWMGTMVLFILGFVVSVVVAVFGWPLTIYFDAITTLEYLTQFSYFLLGLMILVVITGLARDSLIPGKIMESEISQ